MGLFGNKKNRFIGVDFGTSSIKIVELSIKNSKPFLENYGWFDLSGILQENNPNQPKLLSFDERIKMALQSLLKKMNLQGTSVNVSIPGYSGLVVLIEFPDMNDEEVEKAIEFEAHKYIPASIEEVSISWEILKKQGGEDPKKNIEVLLVAAPKREVQRLGNMFAGTEFKLDAVELETFAISRSIVGNDKGTFLLADIGSRATNLMLVVDGTVLVNRSVDVGGNDITNTIADSLSIAKQRAESFKKEGKDIINEKETAIIMPSLELLSGEIKRVISVFKEKDKKANVDKIIISGGSSYLTGIEKYFSNILGVDVVRGNPFRNVTHSPEVAPFIQRTGASLSVAIGLALRGIEDENSGKK